MHIHALVMDGVYAADEAGEVRFHPREYADDDVGPLLATIRRRIEALLIRRGVADGDEGREAPDRWAEEAPALAGLAAASVRGVAALGTRAGASVRRWGDAIDAPDPLPPGRWHSRADGFDLHAGIVVPAGARDRLERLCRYALRPAVGQDRLQLTPDGKAVLELRRRWTDGTTHLVFDPVELLERLAALTPRPRVNLILYHGLLAPRAAWRRDIVPTVAAAEEPTEPASTAEASEVPRPKNRSWAELMQRSFGFDVLACPRLPGPAEVGGVDPGPHGDSADSAPPAPPGGSPRDATVARPAAAPRRVGPACAKRRLTPGRPDDRAGFSRTCARSAENGGRNA